MAYIPLAPTRVWARSIFLTKERQQMIPTHFAAEGETLKAGHYYYYYYYYYYSYTLLSAL